MGYFVKKFNLGYIINEGPQVKLLCVNFLFQFLKILSKNYVD